MSFTFPSSPDSDQIVVNTDTNEAFRFDGEAWNPEYMVQTAGDSMDGTIAYPDMLIKSNTLTAEGRITDLLDDADEVNFVFSPNAVSEMQNQTCWQINSNENYSVAVGDGGKICYSEDGVTWKRVGSGTGGAHLRSVTYGNGIWVAVGEKGSSGVVATSTDAGISKHEEWTQTNVFSSSKLLCVEFFEGFFYAGGFGRIRRSEDGVTWTSFDRPGSGAVRSIYYHEGLYLAGTNASPGLLQSVDGETWTAQQNLPKSDLVILELAHDGKKWIASGNANNGSAGKNDPMIWSASGKSGTWQAGSDLSHLGINDSGGFMRAKYANNLWIICGTKGNLFYSIDGFDWKEFSSNPFSSSYTIRGFAASKDKWMVGSTGGQIAYAEWTGELSPELLFNGDPVVIDRGQTKSLARSVSSLSSRLGTSKYYQSDEPSDSFGIDNGTLWLNPSNAKLSIYHDSDWNQLN